MGRAYNLSGQKFGRLTAIEKDHVNSHGEVVWRCACDCGKMAFVAAHYLVSGHTHSCGCLVSEAAVMANRTHGMTRTKLYYAYTNMMTRCYNERYKNFHAYGGRGISVCEQWRGENGFSHFAEWAVKNGYSAELTLDRIDVNGNYCPQNCRWATMKQQQNNRTNNARIEYNGEVKTMAEWAEHLNISYGKLQSAIMRKSKKLPIAMEMKRV